MILIIPLFRATADAQGGNKVSFSADEYSDELYTLERDGHRLTLGASSPDGLPAERPSAHDAEQPSVTEPSEAASDDAVSSADDSDDDFAAAENDADTAAIDAAADAAESTDAVQNVDTAARMIPARRRRTSCPRHRARRAALR